MSGRKSQPHRNCVKRSYRAPVIRSIGECDYRSTAVAMQQYTRARTPDSDDEIWIVSHPPVFTLGQAADPKHVLQAGDTPVVSTDRGGQVTYHGPGQLVLYVLHDLRRANLGVRQFVCLLEQSVIDGLAESGIVAQRHKGAPGVYVNKRKIAALGVRVRKGCTYHGLALNVSMDLRPYERINPCGFANLEVTQLSDLQRGWSLERAAGVFGGTLARLLTKSGALPPADGAPVE